MMFDIFFYNKLFNFMVVFLVVIFIIIVSIMIDYIMFARKMKKNKNQIRYIIYNKPKKNKFAFLRKFLKKS